MRISPMLVRDMFGLATAERAYVPAPDVAAEMVRKSTAVEPPTRRDLAAIVGVPVAVSVRLLEWHDRLGFHVTAQGTGARR